MLQVEDRDAGVNGQYMFNISDSTNFNVSSTTGALSLIRILDHETVPHRSLPVIMTACDMGTYPAMMCCSQAINIMLRVCLCSLHCHPVCNTFCHCHRIETITHHSLLRIRSLQVFLRTPQWEVL